MPNGLKPPPAPLQVVDAIGDLILHIPKLPAEIVQRVGAAAAATGGEMEQAVKHTTDSPDIPDPITLVTGALDYVLALPKGGINAIRGVADGVTDTFGSAQQRLRSLGR